jgi:hypothetical protein
LERHVLRLPGDLTLNSGALEIEIGGTDPLDYDKIMVTGETTLGGTLTVKLIDPAGGNSPFVPELDDQFAFLATGSLNPLEMFDVLDFSLAELPEGLEWELTTGTTTFLTVVETVVGLEGDFNGDGIVDAADYPVWRNHFGEADETNLNFNGDGNDVGESDYTIWKANYGRSSAEAGGGELASIPEPSSVAIFLIATLIGYGYRRA